MYPVFLEATSVCGQLGICAVKSVLGEPTCEDCTGAVGALADVIMSSEKIDEIVAFLQVNCITMHSSYILSGHYYYYAN